MELNLEWSSNARNVPRAGLAHTLIPCQPLEESSHQATQKVAVRNFLAGQGWYKRRHRNILSVVYGGTLVVDGELSVGTLL